MKKIIERIAKEHLHLETLETRRCSADFREQAVWGIRAALEAAYRAGPSRTKRERQLAKEIKNLIARANELLDALDGTICDGEPEFPKLRKAVSSAEKCLEGGAA